jgi:hypothetical protein
MFAAAVAQVQAADDHAAKHEQQYGEHQILTRA